MFLGQIFAKNAKNDPKIKHFSKRQNRSKNKIRKMSVKSRNHMKVPVFDMFYVISQPFLKISS